MYQMIHSNGLLQTLIGEAPSATAALIFAELFYKFHSFTFECLAFLATWYVFSWVLSRIPGLGRNASTMR